MRIVDGVEKDNEQPILTLEFLDGAPIDQDAALFRNDNENPHTMRRQEIRQLLQAFHFALDVKTSGRIGGILLLLSWCQQSITGRDMSGLRLRSGLLAKCGGR